MRLAAIIALLAIASPALAQEHEGHRPQDMAIHERFYETWMQPDNPNISCCHKRDCQPAATKFEFGHWWARWEGMKDWQPIPNHKIEEQRDSPDGRSHMCGQRDGFGGFNVFCFIKGAGT